MLSTNPETARARTTGNPKPASVKTTKLAGNDEVAALKHVDSRHPNYLGDWKRSIVGVDDDVAWDTLDEPHIKRKHAILQAHPEIASLYGPVASTKWICMFYVAIQLSLAYFFGRVRPDLMWASVLTAYFIGGSVTQVFGVIIHEACHSLCFKSKSLNRAVGFMANICIPFPIYASFRRYHLEHHAYQGVEGKDPDLPLKWEVKFIKGNPLQKFVFLFFYPMMYVVRGAALKKTPSFWELMNWAFTITTDIIIWNVCGPRGLFYLFMSLWLGYGIHPAAAHFIQEHFTFEHGQETYSYYGGLNKIFLNIGFHNEHHDFTQVPWSKLPSVKSIAPEFYECLASHNSWVMVLLRFLFDPEVGPQSRVSRTHEDHKVGRKMVVEMKKVIAKHQGKSLDSGIALPAEEDIEEDN